MRARSTLRTASLWAAAGSLLGVALWSVLGGAVWQLYTAAPTPGEYLRNLPFAILGSAIWASVIGVVALPAYVVVFLLYLRAAQRWPRLEATTRNRFLAATMLGAPPALMLTYGFASGPSFDWSMAIRVLPIAAASCIAAVWLPRRLVPSLRPPLARTAS